MLGGAGVMQPVSHASSTMPGQAVHVSGGGVGNESDLKVDPRTGLDLVDVPYEYKKDFSMLEGSLMHWFGKVQLVTVRKMDGKERSSNRFLLLTDLCVYVLEAGGNTSRCESMKDFKEIVTSRANDIGIHTKDGPLRFDIMLLMQDQAERDKVVSIIKKVFVFHNNRPLPHRHIDPVAMKETLILRKPENWQLDIKAEQHVISKKLLLQRLELQENEYTAEQNLIQDEFERVKAKLQKDLDKQIRERNEEFAQFKKEYQILQEAHNNLIVQYDGMAQDINEYVRMLNEKDMELEEYRAGNHPRIKQMEHEVEKLHMEREYKGEQQKEGASRLLAEREQEIRYQNELLRQREDNCKMMEAQLARKEQELAVSDGSVRERDGLLLSKQSEIKEKDVKLAEKERELRYTKNLMRDTFRRQCEELELIKSQFQQYDDQMVAFIKRTVAGGGGTPSNLPRPPFHATTTPPINPALAPSQLVSPYSLFKQF